jgi:hypothetical protein
MLLNTDWGFFAPLRLCVIFALKKISLAKVFGYAPVKILNKTLATRLWAVVGLLEKLNFEEMENYTANQIN